MKKYLPYLLLVVAALAVIYFFRQKVILSAPSVPLGKDQVGIV